MDYLRAAAGLAAPAQVEVPAQTEPQSLDPAEPVAAENAKDQPASVEHYVELAEQALQREDWVQAELIWQSIRTVLPDFWPAYAGGAAALRGSGRDGDARQLLTEAAARFPHERTFPLQLADLAVRRSDWTDAEAHWRTALTFDVRPWWVYTELAGTLEHQGRLIEAEEVLLEGQARSDEPDEITLHTYPARLAWARENWAVAVVRWADAKRRFPAAMELADRHHEALTRLAEHDPLGYQALLRQPQADASPDNDLRALVLRFESLGGTGPEGGCEFGCFQRWHDAEPLSLFRWAAVPVAGLIAGLENRFARIGGQESLTISPHEGQWEVRDAVYGTVMHSFVSSIDVPAERMIVLASKRMQFLREKLIADLESAEKIFVFKAGWVAPTDSEIKALGQAVESCGSAKLLCVCGAGAEHAPGEIVATSRNVFIGFMDFSDASTVATRRPVWEALCRGMIERGGPADNHSLDAASPIGSEQAAIRHRRSGPASTADEQV
jgi:Flp pilus assembly protein TadD